MSSKDQTSPAPITATIFQQKLFGTGVNLFQMSSVESIVIIINPPLVASDLPSSSDMIFMETSDLTLDFRKEALLEVAPTTSPNTKYIRMFLLLFYGFTCILLCTFL